MRTVSLSLNSMAPGHRVYASAALRSSRRYQVLHPLADNSRTPVYRSRPGRPPFRDLPVTPPPPLSPPSKSPAGESNRSAFSSSCPATSLGLRSRIHFNESGAIPILPILIPLIFRTLLPISPFTLVVQWSITGLVIRVPVPVTWFPSSPLVFV